MLDLFGKCKLLQKMISYNADTGKPRVRWNDFDKINDATYIRGKFWRADISISTIPCLLTHLDLLLCQHFGKFTTLCSCMRVIISPNMFTIYKHTRYSSLSGLLQQILLNSCPILHLVEFEYFFGYFWQTGKESFRLFTVRTVALRKDSLYNAVSNNKLAR